MGSRPRFARGQFGDNACAPFNAQPAASQRRMAAQGITLQADDDAVAALAKDGFDARYGARPLRRTLQTEVEDAVAEQMLEGKLHSGDTAHVCLKDGKVVIEK